MFGCNSLKVILDYLPLEGGCKYIANVYFWETKKKRIGKESLIIKCSSYKLKIKTNINI
jgi:hypothetical protein